MCNDSLLFNLAFLNSLHYYIETMKYYSDTPGLRKNPMRNSKDKGAFKKLVSYKKLRDNLFDMNLAQIETYGCDYCKSMVSSLKGLYNKIHHTNSYEMNLFKDLLSSLITYYEQTPSSNDGNAMFKLSKDTLILLNMLNKLTYPSFLSDIFTD